MRITASSPKKLNGLALIPLATPGVLAALSRTEASVRVAVLAGEHEEREGLVVVSPALQRRVTGWSKEREEGSETVSSGAEDVHKPNARRSPWPFPRPACSNPPRSTDS